MDYSNSISGIKEIPRPAAFPLDFKSENAVEAGIGGMPSGWTMTDNELWGRLLPEGLDLSYTLYGTSAFGVTHKHKVGRLWRLGDLRHISWVGSQDRGEPLALQPAFAPLHDEKKTSAYERARTALASLFTGTAAGTDTAQLAQKVARVLAGEYEDTAWLLRLAYFYIATAVTEISSGHQLAITEAAMERLLSMTTQAGFSSAVQLIQGNGADVIYLDAGDAAVDDELIATATYIANSIVLQSGDQVIRPNLPALRNPTVVVHGRDAGMARAPLTALAHDTVANLVEHYCGMMHCEQRMDSALKTMAFLMATPVGGVIRDTHYAIPHSCMTAGFAGYMFTGPASVVERTRVTLADGCHAFYDGCVRHMLFQAGLNTVRHAAGVHSTVPRGWNPMPTVRRAWQRLLTAGGQGGYASAVNQVAAKAGWPNALGQILSRHAFSSASVRQIYNSQWMKHVVQWAELLPWVTSFPQQSSVVARLRPLQLTTAIVDYWQPIAKVAGGPEPIDGFLTLMLESPEAKVAAIFTDGLRQFSMEVPRLNAVSTGWQADFMIPTLAPHLGGFAEVRAKIATADAIVALQALESRPLSRWKIHWSVPNTRDLRPLGEVSPLNSALLRVRAAQTTMDPQAVEAGVAAARRDAAQRAYATTLADWEPQLAMGNLAANESYAELLGLYQKLLSTGGDTSQLGDFMMHARSFAEMLDTLDHGRIIAQFEPQQRADAAAAVATLCMAAAQWNGTNAVYSNLRRTAAAMNASAAQLRENPAWSLQEVQAQTDAAVDTFVAELRGKQLTADEKNMAELQLQRLLLDKVRVSLFTAEDGTGRIRQALASGGPAIGIAQQRPTDAEVERLIEAERQRCLAVLEWDTPTPTPAEAAAESAANGHGSPLTEQAPLELQQVLEASGTDFGSQQSATAGGQEGHRSGAVGAAPVDMTQSSSLPMGFRAPDDSA